MPANTRTRNAAPVKAPAGTPYDDLKRMLIERQREILNEVQNKIRVVRAEGSEKHPEVLEQGYSEVDIQEDIELALIQMKVETLNRINEALLRLKEGTYGHCSECGEEIAKPRLCAIPFAVRCRDCEGVREISQRKWNSMRCGSSGLAASIGGF